MELTPRTKVIFMPSVRRFCEKFVKFSLGKCYLDVKETFCRFKKSKNSKLPCLLCYVILLVASWVVGLLFWGFLVVYN